MRGIRRVGMATAIALGSLGSAGAVAVVAATPSAAATCTDNWQGPMTGTTAWNAASTDWSSGFPTSSSVVCIGGTTSYTVDLTASTTISSLQLGGTSGTQTLKVDGSSTSVNLTFGASTTSTVASTGVLAMNSSTSGYSDISGPSTSVLDNSGSLTTTSPSGADPVYIETPMTNQSGGTVTIGAPDTRQDDSTLTTNSGSFTVSSTGHYGVTNGGFTDASGATLALTGTMLENSGTFTQSGGTESGNPVQLENVTLADSTGTGSFDVVGTSNLNGTIPSGQTVTVDGTATSVNVAMATAVTDDGTLAMKSSTSGYAQINGAGGVIVASGASLTTSSPSGADPCYIETPVTNQSGGTVTIGAPDSRQDDSTLTTNSGTFTVSSTGHYAVTGGGFTDASGATLTLTGTMIENTGTFTQSGGTESGNPVQLENLTLADSTGTGSFDVVGTSNLNGTIPSGQTVTVDGTATSVNVAMATAVTDDGTLAMKSSTSGYAQINGAGGLIVASGGILTTSSPSGADPCYIETGVNNQLGGTVTIGAPDSRQDDSTLTTNSGTFTVSSTGHYAVTGGGFTDASGATLTLSGTMLENVGTFTQSGGTESGNPVQLENLTLADSTGTGSFDVVGTSNLSGTIPSGQTVTVDGTATTVNLAVAAAVTDDGTLAMKSSTAGYAQINGAGGVTVGSGGAFTTSSPSGADPCYIETGLTNQSGGTVTIGAPDTRQDDGTTTTNAGTLQVVNGGKLTLSSSSVLHNTGTLGVTVNGTAGTGGITGPGVTITGSTLSVTTVGSPAVSTLFTPISGPVTGTFATFIFPEADYAVTYPSSAVQLEVEPAFTTTASALAPKENVALTTPQLATIGSANDGTGTYSATVNYGDGSGVQAATVNVIGPNGTVTGPTHTYTTNGTYTVTTTVSNTDGQVNTVTESVTIDGPVISGFSKNSVKQGKKLSTVVSGTGFDASANFKKTDPTDPWTVSNPGVTVVSSKFAKATKTKPATIKLKLAVAKTAATGPFNVTLTEDTGSYTVNNAITVVAS